VQREIIYKHGITPTEIREDGVQKRIDAYFPPKAPNIAFKIFGFFRDMEKYAIRVGGMSSQIIGLDQWTIGEIGRRDYNIELQRYLPFFKKYEQKLLEKYKRDLEANR